MTTEQKVKEKLQDFIDALTDVYGDSLGVEIKLSYPIVDGQKQPFANIDSIYLVYETREELKWKK